MEIKFNTNTNRVNVKKNLSNSNINVDKNFESSIIDVDVNTSTINSKIQPGDNFIIFKKYFVPKNLEASDIIEVTNLDVLDSDNAWIYVYLDGKYTRVELKSLLESSNINLIAGNGIILEKVSETSESYIYRISLNIGNGLEFNNSKLQIEDGLILNCGTSTEVI